MDRRRHLRCLRMAVRALWLLGEVTLGLMRFVLLLAAPPRVPSRAARARWLQRMCQRVLRLFSLEVGVTGPVPSRGLLVCNHVSYLDILVLAAITPCIFVSKCEVKRWPVFGWFASLAGTLFLRRDRRSDVARMTRAMAGALDSGALVVLFPEGTTSDGRSVFPFKSSLLEPAIGQPQALSAGYIEYALADGDVAEEVCYWKDMTLLPHLVNLLGKGAIEARVRFTELREAGSDRKQLARQLHAEVIRLKEAFSI